MERINITPELDLTNFDAQDEQQQKQQMENNKDYKQTKASMAKELNQTLKEMKKADSRLSNEEIKKKQQLLIQIHKYETSSFGDELKKYGFTFGSGLKSKTIEELEDLLTEIRTTLNSSSDSSILVQGVKMSVGIAEQATQRPSIKPHFDLLGLSQELNSNPEFDKALELVNLEYNLLSEVSPMNRLGLVLVASAGKVYAKNKITAKVEAYRKMLESKQREEEEKRQQIVEAGKPIENEVMEEIPTIDDNVPVYRPSATPQQPVQQTIVETIVEETDEYVDTVEEIIEEPIVEIEEVKPKKLPKLKLNPKGLALKTEPKKFKLKLKQ